MTSAAEVLSGAADYSSGPSGLLPFGPLLCKSLPMALFQSIANLDRLRQIVQVLARHGFGELLARTELAGLVPGRRPAEDAPRVALSERLRMSMQELGPTFVKLG